MADDKNNKIVVIYLYYQQYCGYLFCGVIDE